MIDKVSPQVQGSLFEDDTIRCEPLQQGRSLVEHVPATEDFDDGALPSADRDLF